MNSELIEGYLKGRKVIKCTCGNNAWHLLCDTEKPLYVILICSQCYNFAMVIEMKDTILKDELLTLVEFWEKYPELPVEDTQIEEAILAALRQQEDEQITRFTLVDFQTVLDVLSEASRGIFTNNDVFKESCRIAREAIIELKKRYSF